MYFLSAGKISGCERAVITFLFNFGWDIMLVKIIKD